MKRCSYFLFAPLFAALLLCTITSPAQNIQQQIEQKAKLILPKVIDWRRHIHQNPELGNREVKTAAYIADHLRHLGIEVQTGVAYTGVVGLLKGEKPGPVIALRADIDALPVPERANLPFKSTTKTVYNGDSVSVMHACGHDSHAAILMGAAEVLAAMKKNIAGTVKFIFQPAEEGPPEGEEGGAALMVKEGVMDNPKVDAIFGLHISSGTDIGNITYKVGPDYAASDWFTIKIKGKQAHGSAPWAGIDPVVTGAQIINNLQTIVSRQENIVRAPVVITVAKFHGGVRNNIIPEDAELGGTIRTLDERMRRDVHKKIKQVATNIAEANGATAEVTIDEKTEITFNDSALVQITLPSLQKAAGANRVIARSWTTGAEDFSYFGLKAPAFYFNLGAKNKDTDASKVGHHTPDFFIDDSQLDVGVKAFCNIVLDYPAAKAKWEKEQAAKKKGF